MSKTIRYVKVSGKVNDMSSFLFLDADGNIAGSHEGYPPSELGLGGGDYIKFTLDLTSGTIKDWKPIDPVDLEAIISDT